jgi:hypothetical protein
MIVSRERHPEKLDFPKTTTDDGTTTDLTRLDLNALASIRPKLQPLSNVTAETRIASPERGFTDENAQKWSLV